MKCKSVSWAFCPVFFLLAALFATGCGQGAPAGAAWAMVSAPGGDMKVWTPSGATSNSSGVLILCATGSDISYWDALASPMATEGYRVIVAPPPRTTSAAASQYAAQIEAAQQMFDKAGTLAGHRAVIADGTAAFEAVNEPGAFLGAIAFSAVPAGAPEETMRRFAKCPLLLLACENDTEAASAARGLKDAATGYCEVQVYSCGVRGVDILATVPNVPGQILAWLKPILGGGMGAKQDDSVVGR